jgi:ribonuclease BN (tRNA processing enzyme)
MCIYFLANMLSQIFGLPSLLSTSRGYQQVCTVYGPPGIRNFAYNSLEGSLVQPREYLPFTKVKELVSSSSTSTEEDIKPYHEDTYLVHENESVVVWAKRIKHSALTFGYVIEEKERRKK